MIFQKFLNQDHYSVCPFAVVQCPFPECGMSVQRTALVAHQRNDCVGRLVRCEHCGAEMAAARMQRHLEEECDRVKVPCPNGCSAPDMPRAEVSVARAFCVLAMFRF